MALFGLDNARSASNCGHFKYVYIYKYIYIYIIYNICMYVCGESERQREGGSERKREDAKQFDDARYMVNPNRCRVHP